MDKKILYAAYGSNINLEQMAYRCPNSTVAGTAMLKGYESRRRTARASFSPLLSFKIFSSTDTNT